MADKDQKRELVDPALCEKCGFKDTPLCTHPDSYYQDEPAGLNKLLDSGRPLTDSELAEFVRLANDINRTGTGKSAVKLIEYMDKLSEETGLSQDEIKRRAKEYYEAQKSSV